MGLLIGFIRFVGGTLAAAIVVERSLAKASDALANPQRYRQVKNLLE